MIRIDLNGATPLSVSQTKLQSLYTKTLSVCKNDLVMGKFIGKGCYGSVYKSQLAGLNVAVKVFHQRPRGEKVDKFISEMSLLQSSHHKNVVLFIGLCKEPNRVSIVTEYIPMDLDKLLHHQEDIVGIDFSKFDFSFENKINIAEQCALGIQWVHNRFDIIHKDIKPPNFLVDSDFTVKICDFGFAEVLTDDVRYEGTPMYSSPEIINKTPGLGKATDIYSFGITLWEIFYRAQPFREYLASFKDSITLFANFINKGGRPFMPGEATEDTDPQHYREYYEYEMQSTPLEIENLIKRCWSADPLLRPDINELVKSLSDIKLRMMLGNNSSVEWWKTHVLSQLSSSETSTNSALFLEELNLTFSDTKETPEKQHFSEILSKVGEENQVDLERFSFLLSVFGEFVTKKELFQKMINVFQQQWYFPLVPREVALSFLEGQIDGTFMVRESHSTPTHPLTLSKRENGTTVNSRIKCTLNKDNEITYSITTKGFSITNNNLCAIVEQLISNGVVTVPCRKEINDSIY
ncbi:receptor-interacting serine/threonine protein kinase, putative [Entamoeba invadens IP1]|uniref:Receptor-interacting serine/threonine protein kinase, putative n=1 Tax=Entamoeba invadens IP1 TaxID=370355 RepID=A0A0A1U7L6_ENTIV|nr:receptor-interacting serine/threonine protein kinase, putative [Entamoeba invadens IP1]ELP89046.1 receptor-interacting serine/threonine protein kinase, putative [Entamoeba invadens IP1]|eukprot:XP_004255817.1 receptor-interacting serine/threonine protein kinase, putative [Entamoeba invadens IP1]